MGRRAAARGESAEPAAEADVLRALALAAALLAAWITGLLSGLLAGFGIVVCLVAAAAAGYAVWQGEQALRCRIGEERQRLGKIRAAQENRLYAWQEEHARRFHEWQERRAAYDRQLQWYTVSLPGDVQRVDVAGGTLSGWSALTTLIGASRLSAGGEVTVIDLSEGAAAADLISVARRSGIDPLVWVLPVDLPRLDVAAGLGREELADVLSLVVNVSEEHAHHAGPVLRQRDTRARPRCVRRAGDDRPDQRRATGACPGG